jgi:hypothetical protein
VAETILLWLFAALATTCVAILVVDFFLNASSSILGRILFWMGVALVLAASITCFFL